MFYHLFEVLITLHIKIVKVNSVEGPANGLFAEFFYVIRNLKKFVAKTVLVNLTLQNSLKEKIVMFLCFDTFFMNRIVCVIPKMKRRSNL